MASRKSNSDERLSQVYQCPYLLRPVIAYFNGEARTALPVRTRCGCLVDEYVRRVSRFECFVRKALRVPERILIVELPAYSPELNPSERLWPLVKECVANRTPDTLDELEERVCERCNKLSQQKAEIAAVTSYHWWPTV